LRTSQYSKHVDPGAKKGGISFMKAQLYLDGTVRNLMKSPIELYAETYTKKIIPLFSKIEQESKDIENKTYKELSASFDPDIHCESEFIDEALGAGQEYYAGMVLMQYNMKLMCISTLYQFWEQQVRRFIFEESSPRFIHKKGNSIDFKYFCSRGINDIKQNFKKFNQDLEKLTSWNKINELRLLANVIKHGDGYSATHLSRIRPDFFKYDDENYSSNRLDVYKTTLNDIVLNIADSEFLDYCKAIILFWDELPESMCAK
jgi:hypothetical protein